MLQNRTLQNFSSPTHSLNDLKVQITALTLQTCWSVDSMKLSELLVTDGLMLDTIAANSMCRLHTTEWPFRYNQLFAVLLAVILSPRLSSNALPARDTKTVNRMPCHSSMTPKPVGLYVSSEQLSPSFTQSCCWTETGALREVLISHHVNWYSHKVSEWVCHSTHNKSFRRRVFPGNWLHWYWSQKTTKQNIHTLQTQDKQQKLPSVTNKLHPGLVYFFDSMHNVYFLWEYASNGRN